MADDKKHGYTKCTNSAGDTYILRYTSNASYDGITALQGTADVDGQNALRKWNDYGFTDNPRPLALTGTAHEISIMPRS